MASEQAVVLHSQERPVYINKGSALTQNLIFSAALAGAGTYGLLALQHTLRTGSHWDCAKRLQPVPICLRRDRLRDPKF